MKPFVSWASVFLTAVAVAVAVLTGFWPLILAVPAGLAFVLCVLYYPATGIFFYILGEPILHNFEGIPLGPGIPDLKFNRLIVLLIMTSYFFRYLLRRWKIRPPGRLDYAMLLFSIVAVVNCFRLPNVTNNIQWFLNGYGLAYLFYVLIRNIPVQSRHYRLFFRTMTGVGLFMCFLGIYQKISGSPILVPSDLTSVHIRYGRMTGTYSNSVEFGLLMNITFTVTIYLMMTTQDRMLKLFYGAASALMAFCIYSCMARAIWLGFIITLLIIAFHYRRVFRWLAAASIVSIALLIMFWPIFLESDVVQNRLLHTNPLMDRASNYKVFLLVFPKQPFFGNGYSKDAWKEAALGVMQVLDTQSMQYSSHVSLPHNEFVLTIVMMGLLGLLLYLYYIFEIFRTAGNLKPKLRDPHLLMLFQTAGAMLLINAFFADIINFLFAMHLVMILLAFADNPAAWKQGSAGPHLKEKTSKRLIGARA